MKSFGLIACSLVFSISGALSVWAAPAAHAVSYEKLLKKVATPTGVNWKSVQTTEKNWLQEALQNNAAQSLDAFPTPNDQLAFWINAYNTCVMKFILDHMPIQDVMMIEGFRDRLTCKVAGVERTLIDMESNIIRPLFKNPKVLFALWWGTKGSPRLRTEPYRGESLEKSLDEQARRFIESKEAVRTEEKTLTPSKDFPVKDLKDEDPKQAGIQIHETTLSPLFDWYRMDFGDGNEVLQFILQYLPERSAMDFPKDLKKAHFSAFNWELDQAP